MATFNARRLRDVFSQALNYYGSVCGTPQSLELN